LGNRKGIWAVKNPTLAIPRGSPLEAFRGHILPWSNLQKNKLVKQKPEVVLVLGKMRQ